MTCYLRQCLLLTIVLKPEIIDELEEHRDKELSERREKRRKLASDKKGEVCTALEHFQAAAAAATSAGVTADSIVLTSNRLARLQVTVLSLCFLLIIPVSSLYLSLFLLPISPSTLTPPNSPSLSVSPSHPCPIPFPFSHSCPPSLPVSLSPALPSYSLFLSIPLSVFLSLPLSPHPPCALPFSFSLSLCIPLYLSLPPSHALPTPFTPFQYIFPLSICPSLISYLPSSPCFSLCVYMLVLS